ncbi:MAG TPA: hypothetical protein VFJ43_02455 [Bacteroidia bacterium]|nr:hypothetical protein [Bacteroidia bacterium]
MKTTISLTITSLLALTSFAQTDTTAVKSKFVLAMEKQVTILDTAYTPGTMKQCFNSLQRIAGAEKTEWLPDYYMAYCLVMEAYQDETSKIDDYCDQANQLLDRADSLKGDRSEIFVVRAMTASARIMVNPQSRGAKYGRMSSTLLDSAQVYNANNPRIYLTRGSGVYYTPKMFGGGKDKAKPIFQDAAQKFEAFVPKDTIVPHWGKFRNQQLLADCDKK